MLYRNEAAEEKMNPAIMDGVPRLTLNIADQILYGRVGPFATSHIQAGESSTGDHILGLDLRREGLLTFRSPRQEGSWSFDGAPVSDGRRVYVAMRHSDVTPHAYVACFDAATGTQKWRTSIGAADTPANGAGDEITHNLLTLVENRIYFNTNLGLVAALDADSGDICWITRYDRLAGKVLLRGSAGPLHFDRDPSPCVYHDGLLYAAPSDTPAILAIDAETGKTAWEQKQLPDALHILGVVATHLIVEGERIASVDVATGHVNWIWPDSDRAGIRGMGRGVVAGNEIFWPTRNEIYVIDPRTGAQRRSPIRLSPLTGGANLAVSRGRLIVAGYDSLIVLGPANAVTPKSSERMDVPAPVRTGRLSGQSDVK
jgi:cellulose synthase operon protein C